MTLIPGTRLGPYEIVAALGAGGMGEVYRARDSKLNREVAIKMLPDTFAHDPERLARFEREAKTLAALNHRNIGGIHGLEDASGVTALVMELVEGEDLAERLGWNFRDPSVGSPGEIYQLLGSYIPFAAAKAARQASGDPRLSIEERYRNVDDYLQRIRSAAMDLIRGRYVLDEDLDEIIARANSHWNFATREQVPRSADPR